MIGSRGLSMVVGREAAEGIACSEGAGDARKPGILMAGRPIVKYQEKQLAKEEQRRMATFFAVHMPMNNEYSASLRFPSAAVPIIR